MPKMTYNRVHAQLALLAKDLGLAAGHSGDTGVFVIDGNDRRYRIEFVQDPQNEIPGILQCPLGTSRCTLTELYNQIWTARQALSMLARLKCATTANPPRYLANLNHTPNIGVDIFG